MRRLMFIMLVIVAFSGCKKSRLEGDWHSPPFPTWYEELTSVEKQFLWDFSSDSEHFLEYTGIVYKHEVDSSYFRHTDDGSWVLWCSDTIYKDAFWIVFFGDQSTTLDLSNIDFFIAVRMYKKDLKRIKK